MHSTHSLLKARLTPLATALAFVFAVGAGLDDSPANAASPGAQAPKATAAQRYALRTESRAKRIADRNAERAAPKARPAYISGTTLPVTSCSDDAADPGTLRNVLAGAAEGDTVDLSALTCSTITLTQGPIDSSVLGDHHLYDVTLQGPGRDKLTIDGGNLSQVLLGGGFSGDKGTLTVNDLTIANGKYSGSLAACILNFGGTLALNRVDVKHCRASGTQSLVFGGGVDTSMLVMNDSTITDSIATATGAHSTAAGGGAYSGDTTSLVNSTISGSSVVAPYAYYQGYASVGGGLYSRGDLSMVNSTISGNSIEATVAGEDARGGGIYVRGIATISGSTIDNNHSDGDGGGIFKAIYSVYGEPGGSNPTTKLTLDDSTVSDNTSGLGGGGIGTSRPLFLNNSTVANNTAAEGGGGVLFRLTGVTDSAGPLEMQSTIVANNDVGAGATFAAGIDADDALVTSGANNLVMGAGTAITLPTDTLTVDPMLLPLADNGGPTRTLALRAGSPAIDAGNNAAAFEFDQRGEGYARVSGAAADIGAFEIQQPADDDVIFKDGFDGTIDPTTFVYSYDDGDGDTNQGPPSTFDPDMLWGNYYLTQPGGQVITHISVAFGPTFPSLADGPVTFWLLQDDDGDGDPSNAHAIASVPATPDVVNDNFYRVEISPTVVHGGFFVGASAKLKGGQDKPARVDRNAPGDKSWFFYAPDIAATINDLAAAPFGTRMDNVQFVPFPGAFMIRADAQSSMP